MNTFKVGDKVRVTASGSCYHGMAGVVVEVRSRYPGENDVIVNLTGYKGCIFLPTGLRKL